MAGHLNVFEPYERKAAHHEDALTRAFLLVLRGVPVAHAAWLRMVDAAHRRNGGDGVPQLHELVEPDVAMQTSAIPDGATRVVSVVQTDEHVAIEEDAVPSQRRQVLDGVLGYGELAIVLENKPWHGDIWRGQLDVNVPEDAEHDPRVACVTWSAVVAGWGRLLDSGHLNVAEGMLVGDFLDYVESHFPALRPYSRVGLCGQDRRRLERRCKVALTRIVGADAVGYHRAWGWYVDLAPGQCARKIGLYPVFDDKRPGLAVEIYPGDTMGQARLFYGQEPYEPVAALLAGPNWDGWSNFHLMFMTSGFFHHGRISQPLEFLKLWSENRDSIRQWKRDEYDAAFDKFCTLGVLGPEHREEFDRQTVATKRGNFCAAPGLILQWRLPLDEAARLDDRDALEDVVAAAISAGAKALELDLGGVQRADFAEG